MFIHYTDGDTVLYKGDKYLVTSTLGCFTYAIDVFGKAHALPYMDCEVIF